MFQTPVGIAREGDIKVDLTNKKESFADESGRMYDEAELCFDKCDFELILSKSVKKWLWDELKQHCDELQYESLSEFLEFCFFTLESKMKFRLLPYVLSIVWCLHGNAQELVLKDNINSYPAKEYIYFFKDNNREYNLDKIRKSKNELFAPIEGKLIGEGFSTERFWFRLILTNESSQEFFVESRNFLMDTLIMYYPTENGYKVKRSGLSTFVSDREVKSLNYSFRLPSNLEKDTIYFQTSSEIQSNFPISIMSTTQMDRVNLFRHIFFALIFGSVSLFIVINLGFFVQSRKLTFLFLSLYSTWFIFIAMHYKGFFHLYFYPEKAYLYQNLFMPFSDMMLVFGLLYSYHLMKDCDGFDRIMPFFKILVTIFIISLVKYLILDRPHQVLFQNITPQLSLFALIFMGIYLWRNGNSAMRYYTIGWLIFFVLAVTMTLKDAGIFASNFLTENSPTIGVTFEMLFFTIGTVSSYHIIEKEKEEKEIELVRKLEEMERIQKELKNFNRNKTILEASDQTIFLNEDVLLKLSEREFEILTKISEGKSNNEIADELFVTINTIKTHIKMIYHKLEVHNRVELMKRIIN